MELSNHGREFYALQITTTASDGDPIPLSGWEASFDRGTTWVATVVRDLGGEDWATWLIAGVDAEEGNAVAVIARSMTPLVRAIDNPEILVDRAPVITILNN